MNEFEKIEPVLETSENKEVENIEEKIDTSSIFNDFPEPEIEQKIEPDTMRSGDFEDEIEEPKKRGRKKKKEVPMMPINGKLLMHIIDVAIPFLITLTHNLFNEKKIKQKDVQFSPEQEISLQKIFDDIAEYLQLSIHPVYLLILTVSTTYYHNYNYAKNIQSEKSI